MAFSSGQFGRQLIHAILTGLLAAAVLGAIDAAGAVAGLGTAEWPQLLSLSVLLSTGLYVCLSLLITVLLWPFSRLRAGGGLEAVRLTVLATAGIMVTNLNRLIVVTCSWLSGQKIGALLLS